MKTLYATDLDGTLLDANARLSTETTRLLRQLTQQGALVTFITARTPATVENLLKPWDPSLPGVAMTGASIWNPMRRNYDVVHFHRPGDVEIIDEICHRHGISPFVYTLPDWTEHEPRNNSLKVYHESAALTDIEKHFVEDRTISDLKSFSIGSHYPSEATACTVLFFAMGEPHRIKAVAEEIRERTDCYASWYPDTYNPGLSLLEVFGAGVSKAEGLLELKRRLGADRVVAFGDNLNDIPMLQAADVAIAVANAHPEVKADADIVIGPNTTDAVPHYILDNE